MRAFTFGRSAWESKPFTPATTDIPVNTGGVNVNGTAVGLRLSTGKTGKRYSVAWADDRIGANNFHAYYRGYGYDANNKPTPLGADFRVDDTYSTHVVQGVSVSQYRNANVTPIYARVAWHDNRNGVNNVFFNLVYSDGSRLFSPDLRGDQAGPGLNAKNPSVVPLLSTGVFLAWQQDRTTGTNPPQDIYGDYFQGIGPPYTPPCKISSTTASAQRPAVAADSHDQVFVVWEDPPRIYASKYDLYGNCLIGSGMDCSGSGLSCAALPSHPPASVALDDGGGPANMIRSQPAITIDDADNVLVTWWESDPALTGARIVAKRCNNQLASCSFLDSQCGKRCVNGPTVGRACFTASDCPDASWQCSRLCVGGINNGKACSGGSDCPSGVCPLPVSCPPAVPQSANTAKASSVATLVPPTPGAASPVVLAWQGNVNNPGASLYSGFARSFDASLGKLRNDFRFDRASISDVEDSRVARSFPAGQAVFVWRDNRLNSGARFNVYTQVAPAQ